MIFYHFEASFNYGDNNIVIILDANSELSEMDINNNKNFKKIKYLLLINKE